MASGLSVTDPPPTVLAQVLYNRVAGGSGGPVVAAGGGGSGLPGSDHRWLILLCDIFLGSVCAANAAKANKTESCWLLLTVLLLKKFRRFG